MPNFRLSFPLLGVRVIVVGPKDFYIYVCIALIFLFHLYTDDDRFEIPDRLTREPLGIERKDPVSLPYMGIMQHAHWSIVLADSRRECVVATCESHSASDTIGQLHVQIIWHVTRLDQAEQSILHTGLTRMLWSQIGPL